MAVLVRQETSRIGRKRIVYKCEKCGAETIRQLVMAEHRHVYCNKCQKEKREAYQKNLSRKKIADEIERFSTFLITNTWSGSLNLEDIEDLTTRYLVEMEAKQ